jgi:hypothetical protein
MPNIPEEQLDDLFKKSAENRPVPFDEKAWLSMQHKLKQAKSKSFWLKIFLGGLSVILLVGWSGFYFASFKKTIPFASSQATSAKNSESILQKSFNRYFSNESEPILQKSFNRYFSNESESILHKPFNRYFSNESEVMNHHQPIQIVLKDTVHSNTKSGQIAHRYTNISENVKEENNIHPINMDVLLPQPLQLPKINLQVQQIEKVQEKDKAEPKKDKYGTLGIGLAIAPDITSAEGLTFSKISQNVGLVVEYQFLQRWSISTGIMYANKLYDADADTYNPSQDYWNTYTKPDKIEAKCQVIDVPINLRFNAIQTSKMKVFVTAGISSYWMLTEKYNYKYSAGGGYYPTPSYSLEKKFRNENTHYFGIANFSFGLEKSLNQRLSLQIEPFYKMPITKIGFGKVPLKSVGTFITLKYKLIQK